MRNSRKCVLELLELGGGASFVGPYDDIPNITAAYGMRRLLSSYESNLIRLRRSSDNVEQDFGYTADGALDVAAIATFLGANSGLVVTWYDQSGNGSNATQSTAANQPLYVASVQNSLPGLLFDGSNDQLNTTHFPATGANARLLMATFNIVSFNTGIPLNHVMSYGAQSSGALFGMTIRNSSVNRLGNHFWFSEQSGSALSTQSYIAATAYTGTQALLFKNGAPDGTATTSLNTGATIGLVLGGRIGNAERANIHLMEVVTLNSYVANDRAAAETAMNDYWSVY